MSSALWYPTLRSDEATLLRVASKLNNRQRKVTTMTPSNDKTPTTKPVQRTVFDLILFDDVKLTKTVTLPSKPASVENALEACNHDTSAFLEIFYDGLCERALEASKQDISDFKIVAEDGTATEVYTGTPVSEEKGVAINAAILGLAKAMGYSKDLSKEQKRALKEQAVQFMRSNPAMLASIQG